MHQYALPLTDRLGLWKDGNGTFKCLCVERSARYHDLDYEYIERNTSGVRLQLR